MHKLFISDEVQFICNIISIMQSPINLFHIHYQFGMVSLDIEIEIFEIEKNGSICKKNS